MVSGGWRRLCIVGEVRGSNPTDSHIFYIQPLSNQWVTRGAHRLGHVSSYHLPPKGHMAAPDSPTVNQSTYAMSPLYGRTVLPRQTVRTVRTGTVSIKFFFACLAWRTDHNIFSIRSPFDRVNIPPESGRRDGRNDIVFVAFRALWNLSKIWSPDQTKMNYILCSMVQELAELTGLLWNPSLVQGLVQWVWELNRINWLIPVWFDQLHTLLETNNEISSPKTEARLTTSCYNASVCS
jgi:hypothetical protein